MASDAAPALDTEADSLRTRILVFIPAYNCERQLPRVVAQFTPDIQELIDCIVVIDNRSTDGTLAAAGAALARSLQPERYVLLRNRRNNGLGGRIRSPSISRWTTVSPI